MLVRSRFLSGADTSRLPSAFVAPLCALLLGAAAIFTLLALGHNGGSQHVAAAEPIKFVPGSVTGLGVTFSLLTSLTFGPDGRLYVAEQEGRIRAFTLDPVSKEITAVELVAADTDLQEVFGIAFDPTDLSSPPPVYATNTISGFGAGGAAPDGSFPGKVTKIDGAGYANKTDIITGLSVSDSAHQANGLDFASDGTLYIAHGSTTNAGVNTPLSFLFKRPEVPLSAAVLVANPSAPGFDGNITYDPPNTYGTDVDQISGDVSVYASGLRNPYDIIVHSNGRIYVTDNGPNFGIGPASTGCLTEGPDPEFPDELNLIEAGGYYGHPNRNRGRVDPRQCIFHPSTEGSGADWTGPLTLLPTSSDGLVEYTSDVFDNKLQGNIFYVSFVDGVLGRVVLSPDGTSVVSHDPQFATGFSLPLDVTVGPDGTLYIAEYATGAILTLEPLAGDPLIDTDGDGCKDKAEQGFNPGLGGLRDPDDVWDFFDTPDASNVRDKAITIIDIFAVGTRFGASGDTSGDPLAGPIPPAPGYHTAFDRGGQTGANIWNQAPADGSITTVDIFAVAAQFGHDCR